jgi:cytochrome c oxidase subunit II
MAFSNTEVIFNNLFGLFTYLAVLVGVVVFAFMTILIIKYRERKDSQDPEDTPRLGRIPMVRGHGRNVLITLSLSTIIVVALIVGSFAAVDTLLTPPNGTWCYGLYPGYGAQSPLNPDCPRIDITGHQFYWQFSYPHAYPQPRTYTTRDNFRVPRDATVVIDVTSADVFHDFGIIPFKIKTDAVPGRVNTIWFEPYQNGTFLISCFELCGSGHYYMNATLIVLPLPMFQQWYNST